MVVYINHRKEGKKRFKNPIINHGRKCNRCGAEFSVTRLKCSMCGNNLIAKQ